MWFRKPKIIWHVPEGREDLIPRKAHPGDMAYDLVSPTSFTLRRLHIVNTLVAVTLPKGYGLILEPRSGLAAKHAVSVGGGVIDNNYRGLLKVILFNHSKLPLKVQEGHRIAQARVVKIHEMKNCVSYRYPDASKAGRGQKGLGSTGR